MRSNVKACILSLHISREICITFVVLDHSIIENNTVFLTVSVGFSTIGHLRHNFAVGFMKITEMKSHGFKNLPKCPEKVRTDAFNRRS